MSDAGGDRNRATCRPFGGTVLACLALACAPAAEPEPAGYAAEIEQWRRERVERLTGETGWLSLAGLHWFEEGEHTLGSEPGSAIELPEKAPPRVGVLRASAERVRLEVEPSVEVLHEGAPVERLELATDDPGPPTVFEVGDLVAHVIERDGRRALRIKDRAHPARAAFEGIDSYPVDWEWRRPGRFEPYDPVRTLPIPTVLGNVSQQPSSGAVVFEVDGARHRLDVVAEPGDEELFVIFADQTSGRETYGGGRYLYVDAPDSNGKVVVDFNKAYNPPCVFTPYATCPLPPAQNRLPLAVEAGEKSWGAGKP